MTATGVVYAESRMQIDSGDYGRLASAYSAKLSDSGFATSVLHRHEQPAKRSSSICMNRLFRMLKYYSQPLLIEVMKSLPGLLNG
jgi:hypothetical protein